MSDWQYWSTGVLEQFGIITVWTIISDNGEICSEAVTRGVL